MEAWVTIVYTGTIYQGKEDPTKLFQALAELGKEGEIKIGLVGENLYGVQVDIYGDYEGWLDKEIREYGLQDVVKQHGKVSREIALQKQREAQVLWLIKWEDVIKGDGWLGRILPWMLLGKSGLEYLREFNRRYAGKPETGCTPAKLYEYIAARRPILATGGYKDEVNKILDDIRMGVCCETVEEIKNFIRSIY